MEPNTIQQTPMAPQVNVMNPTGVDPNAAMAQMGELSNRQLQNTLSQRQTAMQGRQMAQQGRQFNQEMAQRKQQMDAATKENELSRQHDISMENLRNTNAKSLSAIEAKTQIILERSKQAAEERRNAAALARRNGNLEEANNIEKQANDLENQVNDMEDNYLLWTSLTQGLSSDLDAENPNGFMKGVISQVQGNIESRLPNYNNAGKDIAKALIKAGKSHVVGGSRQLWTPDKSGFGGYGVRTSVAKGIMEDPNNPGYYFMVSPKQQTNIQAAKSFFSGTPVDVSLEKNKDTGAVEVVRRLKGFDSHGNPIDKEVSRDPATDETTWHATKEELIQNGFLRPEEVLPDLSEVGSAMSRFLHNQGYSIDQSTAQRIVEDLHLWSQTNDENTFDSVKTLIDGVIKQNKDKAGTDFDESSLRYEIGNFLTLLSKSAEGGGEVQSSMLEKINMERLAQGGSPIEFKTTDSPFLKGKMDILGSIAGLSDKAADAGLFGQGFRRGTLNMNGTLIPNLPEAKLLVNVGRELMGSADNVEFLKDMEQISENPMDDFAHVSPAGQKLLQSLNPSQIKFLRDAVHAQVTKHIAEHHADLNVFGTNYKGEDVRKNIRAQRQAIESMRRTRAVQANKDAPPPPAMGDIYDDVLKDVGDLYGQ